MPAVSSTVALYYIIFINSRSFFLAADNDSPGVLTASPICYLLTQKVAGHGETIDARSIPVRLFGI